MNWTVDAFLQELNKATSLDRERRLNTLSELERKQYTINALKRGLGQFPEDHIPMSPQLIERKEYDEFYMERLTYTTMPHVQVPVLVLVPKEKKEQYSAVLACHGHGSGHYDALGMDAAGNWLDEPGIHQRIALQLVRKGLIVVLPEVMGFGARRIAKEMNQPPGSNSCATLSAQLLMNGRTLAGMRVYEAMRALDYMQTRADIKPDRIGAFGFSGGSLIAAYTAVLDERMKAIVLSGWMNTFADSILSIRHCIDNYVPSLLQDAEQTDIVELLAPRPLFIEAGEHDHIFPVQATRRAVKQLEEHYAALGAAQQLDVDIHPGKHQISGVSSVPWLVDQLGVSGSA